MCGREPWAAAPTRCWGCVWGQTVTPASSHPAPRPPAGTAAVPSAVGTWQSGRGQPVAAQVGTVMGVL